MIRRPPRSTLSSSSAASDVYKRQGAGPHRAADRGAGGVHRGGAPAAGRAAADPAGPGPDRAHGSVRRHLRPAAQRLLRAALDAVDAAVPGVAARPPGRGSDPDPAGGPGAVSYTHLTLPTKRIV